MSDDIVANAAERLRAAIDEVSPDYVVSMVSGGKDSAASHAVALEAGITPDLVIHGNTRCGIPETSQFVEATYGASGIPLAIADAGSAYEDYVLRKGFFGKGYGAHAFAYRVLKAGPFRKLVSAELRQRRRGVKILLLNGARADESENRQRNLKPLRADPGAPGNIWASHIIDWSADQRDQYLASRAVPINPVAVQLCRSGECMCGTMQSLQERAEAAALYPQWGEWLAALEAEVRDRHGFGWGESVSDKPDPKQMNLFEPMCSSCKQDGE